MRGFFVAGTDTGVGWAASPGASPYAMSKFAVRALATAITPELRLAGVTVTLISPGFVASNIRRVNNQGTLQAGVKDPIPAWLVMSTEKAARHILRAVARGKREAIITGHGKALVAAEAEGKAISVERIEQFVARAAPRAVVVEAAGGLLVPLAREVASLTLEQADPAERAPAAALVTNLDLAERLGLPVLLVGRAGLGTLNHCALSAEALARRGVELRAIVLNRVAPEDDPSVATNARLVEELTGAMVLGPTPFIADASARPAAIAIALARLVGGG